MLYGALRYPLARENEACDPGFVVVVFYVVCTGALNDMYERNTPLGLPQRLRACLQKFRHSAEIFQRVHACLTPLSASMFDPCNSSAVAAVGVNRSCGLGAQQLIERLRCDRCGHRLQEQERVHCVLR